MSHSVVATRRLGRNGPLVSAIGFGLMGLHMYYGEPTPDEECFAILDRALELGCTFWDTAVTYGGNEEMIGRYFKARPGARDKVFIATKFCFAPGDETYNVRGDRDFVIEQCNGSLARLGVDCIDLFQVHRIDTKTPIEVTMRALVELKDAGKIRHIGLSECSAETLRRACAVHPVAALQIEYSAFSLDIEHASTNLLATCRELGVAVVAYAPLSRGILSGRLRSTADFAPDDLRRMMPRYSEENFGRNLDLVNKFSELASAHHGHGGGATPSQLALAWLLAQGDDIIPIPGTTRIKNLEENVGATRVQLSADELAEIRAFVDAADVQGTRYAESYLSTLISDTPIFVE